MDGTPLSTIKIHAPPSPPRGGAAPGNEKNFFLSQFFFENGVQDEPYTVESCKFARLLAFRYSIDWWKKNSEKKNFYFSKNFLMGIPSGLFFSKNKIFFFSEFSFHQSIAHLKVSKCANFQLSTVNGSSCTLVLTWRWQSVALTGADWRECAIFNRT